MQETNQPEARSKIVFLFGVLPFARPDFTLSVAAFRRLHCLRMTSLCRWMLIPLALVLSAGGLAAASLGENRAYNAAAKAFTDKVWDRAETQFAQFILNYPKSTRAPEVVLLQAEAQFQQQKFAQAIALLAARQAGAGKLADGYLYWIGEAEFQSTTYPAAADAFARLVQNYPASTNRLQASVGEAAARAKLGEWARVVELLETPDGVFQKAVWAGGTNEWAARGYLLLSEAQLTQKNYPAAETALQLAASQPLKDRKSVV